jgi:GNAT superfamily N-acetyltransferase
MDDTTAFRIEPFAVVAGDARAIQRIDDIFFTSSSTQTFADDRAKAAFRETWLGRYLERWSDLALVAIAGHEPVGYVIGAHEDPATIASMASDALVSAFAEHSRRFPAHLHINLAPSARNRGIGGRLIERFVSRAALERVPGVHVLTSRASPNVSFYRRHGFLERASQAAASGDVVFLARALG